MNFIQIILIFYINSNYINFLYVNTKNFHTKNIVQELKKFTREQNSTNILFLTIRSEKFLLILFWKYFWQVSSCTALVSKLVDGVMASVWTSAMASMSIARSSVITDYG